MHIEHIYDVILKINPKERKVLPKFKKRCSGSNYSFTTLIDIYSLKEDQPEARTIYFYEMVAFICSMTILADYRFPHWLL